MSGITEDQKRLNRASLGTAFCGAVVLIVWLAINWGSSIPTELGWLVTIVALTVTNAFHQHTRRFITVNRQTGICITLTTFVFVATYIAGMAGVARSLVCLITGIGGGGLILLASVALKQQAKTLIDSSTQQVA